MSLQEAIHRGRRAVDPTPELGHFDPATGLAVRDLFEERLEQQWQSCQDEHRPLGLLLLDFDGLQSYREQNGSAAAEQALSQCAVLLKSICRRRADLGARVRSGEFAILASDVNAQGVRILAERVRQAIAELQLEFADEPGRFLTVSIGAACVVPPASHFAHTLIIACDHALRDAKEAGGNRIQVRRRL